MDEQKKMSELVEDSYRYASQWKKEHNGRVIGYFCSYTPEEIIHAAGMLPFRIFGKSHHGTLADSHLQSYCCSLVKGGLEEALSGALNFLDGTVFPHTCDSIQRLSDIWRLNVAIPAHFDIVLPVKLNTESAKTYFIQVYKKFKADFEGKMGVSISDEKLKSSIELYNDIRKLFMELYEMRCESPEIISGKDFHAFIMGSMLIERESFRDILKSELESIRTKIAGAPASKRKRLMIAGGVCTHPEVYGFIEQAGGAVVWDDLCTGTRLFKGNIDTAGDPVEAIANRYMERINCPAKHSTPMARGESLLKEVAEKRADGVIFLYLKFCDPHHFDYPYLKEFLDSRGVPSLYMEIEDQLPPEGQMRTRLEAFLEML